MLLDTVQSARYHSVHTSHSSEQAMTDSPPPLSAEALARLANEVALCRLAHRAGRITTCHVAVDHLAALLSEREALRVENTALRTEMRKPGQEYDAPGDGFNAVMEMNRTITRLRTEREALAREVEALREANDGLHTLLAAKAHGYDDMEWRVAAGKALLAARSHPPRTDV